MSENPFAERKNPSVSSDNPYQSPQAMTELSYGGGSDAGLSRAADMLRQTKPWVRVISVLMFIAAALMVLAGFFIVGIGASRAPVGIGAAAGIVYIVMAVLYVIPAVFLWMYADRIGIFLRQRSLNSLATALQAQKSFWKFVGVVALIVICIYAVVILFAVLAGIAGA